MLIISLILICQWSEPVNISNTPPGGYYGSAGASVAIDALNNFHYAWVETFIIQNEYSDIFYTKQINDTFVVAINISNTPSISGVPDIVIDKHTQIHVFWSEWISDAGAYIFWRKKEGGVWSPIDTLSKNTEGVAGIVQAVADTLGRVHVVWDQYISSRYYTNVFYRYYDGKKWVSPVRLNTLAGAMNPDIAIDSKQQLHIVWQQAQIDSSTAKNIELLDIFYQKFDGNNWSEITNITNLPLSGSCDPKIAVDGRGYIYVVWEERGIKGLPGPDYSCWFSFSDGDDWSQPQIFDGDNNRFPIITVSDGGEGCFFWTDFDGWVHARFFNNNKVTEIYNIPTTNKNGFIWDAVIKEDTVFAIFSCLENDTISNSAEIYYSKCVIPNFPELSDTQSAYLTFIGKANIPYTLSEGGNVTFDLYDSLGRFIKRVDLGYKPAGSYIKPVSLASFQGASGVYFYRIYTSVFETKGKLVLPK